MASPTVVACPSCGRRNRVPAAAAGTPRCGQCHTPVPWIVDAGEHDFTEVAEQDPLPVLVDLWAPWCGPCRMVTPALEELARTYAGRIELVEVDVDTAPGTAQRSGVQGVPTLLLLHRGRLVDRQVGAAPAAVLGTWLENALSSTAARR